MYPRSHECFIKEYALYDSVYAANGDPGPNNLIDNGDAQDSGTKIAYIRSWDSVPDTLEMNLAMFHGTEIDVNVNDRSLSFNVKQDWPE